MKRKCPECGIEHELTLIDSKTYEVIEEIEKCRGCFLGFGPKGHMKDGMPFKHEQITLDDDKGCFESFDKSEELKWIGNLAK
jgi:hypothetical protein